MFVAASTRCFPDVPFDKCLQKLADLDFSSAEIVVGDASNDLRPEWIIKNFQTVAMICSGCRQIAPKAFFLDISPEDSQYFAKFEVCMRLCKILRPVTAIVKSLPLGAPFNEEYERLRRLTQIGLSAGVVVSLLTESSAISGSIDSLNSLCRSIPELTIALDPSHFIYKHKTPINYDSILPKTSFVRLRDTTSNKFQVQIGQGELEYNKLVVQLNKIGYRGALCVALDPLPDLDSISEMRKMRLLMESLLL